MGLAGVGLGQLMALESLSPSFAVDISSLFTRPG